MTDTERKLMKRVGEEAWKRGKLHGEIESLILDYKRKNAVAESDLVPEFVIEDLEALVNKDG